MSGLPPHIAQVIAGHRDIYVTMGYKAVYPDDGVGDEDSPEVVGRIVQGLSVSRVLQSSVDESGVEHGP